MNRLIVTCWLFATLLVLALVSPLPAQAPLATPTPEVMSRLKTRAEVVVFTLMSGDPSAVAGQMAPGVRKAWGAETCKSVFGDLMQRGGLLQGTDPATMAIHDNGHVIATIPINYARNSVAAQVVFERAAPLAKVVGFSVQPYQRPESTPRTEGGAPPPDAVAAPEPAVGMPAYAQRELFVERRVEVPAAPELRLPAIITLPTIAGSTSPVPAVVLIPANGDVDEDGTVNGVKPLRDLAHGLATLGVASIRYARRSFVDPASMQATPAPDLNARFTSDAVQATRVLAGQKEVDPRRISIVGTELGALVAPLVARETKAQAVVLLAPMRTPSLPAVSAQARALLDAPGAVPDAARAEVERVASAVDRAAAGSLEPTEVLAGLPVSVWIQLDMADPIQVLAEDRRPFAVLWPGAAAVLNRPEDRAEWQAAADAAAPLAVTRTYPGINHALIPVAEGLPLTESLAARGNVGEAVVRDVASYVTLGQLTPERP